MIKTPTLYALDFDGVICDSAVETAITGWKAAATLWPDMTDVVPTNKIEQFREIRPMIETGYEAILAMRLLQQQVPIADIFKHYSEHIQALLQEAKVTVNDLKHLFGVTRDQWIAKDLADWVAMNPLFNGIADKLKRLIQAHECYIITTKQERFVKHILNAHDIELANERIFGLDRNMTKVEVLKDLLKVYPAHTVYFVEDRLPTLFNVLKHQDLATVKLIFALWGYNTDEDKQLASKQPFVLQQLDDFLFTDR